MKVQNKRSALTVIELVFVIVILGLLAAAAIPKLAATRTDAWVSTIAQNTMTGAFEIATYAAAKSSTKSKLSDMSQAITMMVNERIASEASPYLLNIAAEKSGSNCLVLRIENPGAETEILHIDLEDTEDIKCLRLQKLIDASTFPMRLRGSILVY